MAVSALIWAPLTQVMPPGEERVRKLLRMKQQLRSRHYERFYWASHHLEPGACFIRNAIHRRKSSIVLKRIAFAHCLPIFPFTSLKMNSMLSIFNRISGAYLTGVVLASYLLYAKMGSISLTYPGFYGFRFHVSEQIPFFVSVTAMAVLYHVVKGTRSLMTHAKPFPKFF